MRNLEAQQNATNPAATIVVASRPLRFGDELSALSLREIPWPPNALPPGSFSKISELTSAKRIVLAPIDVNEPILAAKITGPGQRATLSAMLSDGMKAVTIRVDDVADVAGFVLPGDRVDVVLTRPRENKGPITDVVLENVRVLGVDQLADQRADKPSVVKAVTLEVDEIGGQKLALASRVGSMSLLLRKAGDRREDDGRELTSLDLTPRRHSDGGFALQHDHHHAAIDGRDLAGRVQRSDRGQQFACGGDLGRATCAQLKLEGTKRRKGGTKWNGSCLGTTNSGGEADMKCQYEARHGIAGASPRYHDRTTKSSSVFALRKRSACGDHDCDVGAGAGRGAGSGSRHLGGSCAHRDGAVTLGKSQDVRTDQSIADIVVGDASVADVNPLTDRSLSILGKKIGTTRVTVYGPDKKPVGVFDIEVSYDVSQLSREIEQATGHGIKVSSVNGRIMLERHGAGRRDPRQGDDDGARSSRRICTASSTPCR